MAVRLMGVLWSTWNQGGCYTAKPGLVSGLLFQAPVAAATNAAQEKGCVLRPRARRACGSSIFSSWALVLWPADLWGLGVGLCRRLRRGVDGDYRAPAGRASGALRRAKASSEIRSSVSAVFSPDMLC